MRTQTRGICQLCGREQAIKDGRMAHHGYTVKNGWFEGACQGYQFPPMQKSIVQTEIMLKQLRIDIAKLRKEVVALDDGKVHPKFVNPSIGVNREPVEWDKANTWDKEAAVRKLIWQKESRIRAGESFSVQMLALASEVHGQPLREVKVSEGPEPISIGEKRKDVYGRVLTVTAVHGARVYWTVCIDGHPKLKGWTGSGAWRKLALVKE